MALAAFLARPRSLRPIGGAAGRAPAGARANPIEMSSRSAGQTFGPGAAVRF